MFKPKSIYTKVAFETIKQFILSNKLPQKNDSNLAPELLQKGACFVTLRTGNGNLRGCIGTLSPVYENLYVEIQKNAISAAVNDSRFPKLTAKEINDLSLSVEILSVPEKIENIDLLDPKKYGLIIKDGHRRGVLLPDINGVETIEEQIRIVKRKAGIFEINNNKLEFYRFTTQKFR